MYGASKITILSNIIGVMASIVGIVTFFCGFPIVTIVCAVITLFDSFIQVIAGDQNNFITEIVTIIIGVIVGLTTTIGVVDGISIALCFGCLALAVVGWAFILISGKRL